MRFMTLLLTGCLLAAPALRAEVPVLRDRILTIEEAVAFDNNGPAYYGDIRLQANDDGTFSIMDAQRRNLALVEKVDVQIAKSMPVQVAVRVNGILSVACVALEETSISRSGNVFNVVLAETTMEPGSVCMSLVAVTPFELDIPLRTSGLPAGNYSVNVNGSVVDFTL